MKRKAIIGISLLVIALLVCGCKSEEQIAQNAVNEPTVVSPEVNVTVDDKDERSTMNVSGSGSATAVPDEASVNIAIESSGDDAAATQADNAALVAAVTAAIVEAGVDESNITTGEVSLSEVYNYEKSPAELTGYRMTTVLETVITPAKNAGNVIGVAIAAGATSTYGLSFTVSDSADAYGEALSAAIADAKAKAAVMSESLGVTLSPLPISVSETSSSYTPVDYAESMMYDTAEAAANSGAVESPVSTGELTIEANVTIVYEILSAE